MNQDALEEKYAWVRRLRMAVLEEQEAPVWRRADEVAEVLEAMGAQAVRYPAIGWAVHYFDRSEHLPKYRGQGERDLVAEMIEATGRRGIRVIPYCHIGVLHTWAFEPHPEWAALDRSGRPIPWNNVHKTVCLCHAAFRDAMTGAVGEVVSRYDPPALYFDGPAWYNYPCLCEDCKATFQKVAGYDLPETLSWEDGSEQNYHRMRWGVNEGFMAQLNRAIKAIKDIPVFFNTGMHHNSGQRNGSIPERNIRHAEGANTTEVHRRAANPTSSLGGNYMSILESAKLGETLKKTSLCYLPPGPFESMVTCETLDVQLFGMTYLAHGGTPMVETVEQYLRDRTGVPQVRAFFEWMERHADLYYDSEPVRETCLVYSRTTAEHYGREDVTGRYGSGFSGALRALVHTHQHFDCLYDSRLDAEHLKGYRTLFLANAACMDDAQTADVAAFVKAGGGLVATYQTSLYDEKGRRREDFGLADLFGVHFRGNCPDDNYFGLMYRAVEVPGYPKASEAYLRFGEGHPLRGAFHDGASLIPASDAFWGGMVPEKPRYLLTEADDAADVATDVVAELFLPSKGAYGEPFEFPYGRPPGIVARQVGKGRVVYVASDLTHQYVRRGLPMLRRVIGNVVQWAGGGRRLLEVDGPACLVAYVTERRGERIVHLINYTGNAHEVSYPMEWVPELRDVPVRLRLDGDRGVKGVDLLVEGRPADFDVREGVLYLTVPTCGLYEAVIVRLGGG